MPTSRVARHRFLTPARRELTATELAVDALAAYRLTRLVTVDTVPAAVAARSRVTGWARSSGHPAIEELIHCPWCIGFWIASAVVVARAVTGRFWSPIARVLAFSAASGIVAHYLSDEVVQVKPVEPEPDSELSTTGDHALRTISARDARRNA